MQGDIAWDPSAMHAPAGAVEARFGARSLRASAHNTPQLRKLQQTNATEAEVSEDPSPLQPVEDEEAEGEGRGVFWKDWRDWTWPQKAYFVASWAAFATIALLCCYACCCRRDRCCMRWSGQPEPEPQFV